MECQQRAGSLLHSAAPVPQPAAKRASPGRSGAKQRGGRGSGAAGQQLSAEEQQVAGRELEVSMCLAGALHAFARCSHCLRRGWGAGFEVPEQM